MQMSNMSDMSGVDVRLRGFGNKFCIYPFGMKCDLKEANNIMCRKMLP